MTRPDPECHDTSKSIKFMTKENLDLEFEYWIRDILPKQLNLSDAKKAAMNSLFYHFSDSVKLLVKKALIEFDIFFSGLKKIIEKTSKKRCPKGYFTYCDRYYEKKQKR